MAGMAIHNSKVVSSSPTPATNFPLLLNNLRTMSSSNRFWVGLNLCPECPEQTLGSHSDRPWCSMVTASSFFTFPPILYHFPTVFCPGDAVEKKDSPLRRDHGVEPPTLLALSSNDLQNPIGLRQTFRLD